MCGNDGLVIVSGLLRLISGSWGYFATLPSGCRPDKRLIFNVNQNIDTARVDILTDGRMQWVNGNAGSTFPYLSVSGIAFYSSRL